MSLLARQLDYLFFLRGLAFILLASVCLFEGRKKGLLPWTWLGFLGLTNGMNEWLNVLGMSMEDSSSFKVVRIGVLVLSSVCLSAGLWSTLASFMASRSPKNSTVAYHLFFLGMMLATYVATCGSTAPYLPVSVLDHVSILRSIGSYIEPLQVVLVILLGIFLRRSVDLHWGKGLQKTHRILCVYTLLVILAGGWFLTNQIGKSEYRKWIRNLQSTCSISGASISSELVRGIDSIEDLHNPRYVQLKKRLLDMREAAPEFRYLYLMVVRKGRIIFSADSEPPTSKDYSPPGDEYTDAPPELRALCRGEVERATAEYQDRWGKWFSAFIPVRDDATGKPVAVFGLDYSQTLVLSAIDASRVHMIAITLLLVILTILAFYFRERSTSLIASISDARDSLQSKEEYLSSMLHSIGDAVISTDIDGRVTRMNRVAQALTGWTAKDAANHPVMEVFHIIHGSTRIPASNAIAHVLCTKESSRLADDTIIISQDGVERQIACSCSPIRHNQGHTIGAVLVFRDVTEEYRQRDELIRSEARFDHLAEQSRTIVWEVNPDGLFTYVSHVSEDVFGYKPEEIIGRMHFYDLHEEVGRKEFKDYGLSVITNTEPFHDWEHAMLAKDGHGVWVCTNGFPLFNAEGNLEGYHGSDTDITHRKEYEKQLSLAKSETEALNSQLEEALLSANEYAVSLAYAKAAIEDTATKLSHQASHDELTGLPNRSYFEQHLNEMIACSTGNIESTITVLFLDLDKFKLINDTLGHKVGDLLLVEVAGRLQSCIRPDDILARMGGDEFTVILMNTRDATHIEAVASRMIDAVSRPYEIQGHKLVVGVSIGMASYPADGTDSVSLLRSADAAMYKAKQSGRGLFYWYSGDVDAENQQRAGMEMDIRTGFEQGQFSVHYQPIVSLENDGSVLSAEALLRWHHPQKGIISPSLFVPIAEEMGIIGQIGDYVLRTACAQTVAWREEGIYLSQVQVNVSTRQIRDAGWPESVWNAISDTGMDAACLNLEVTETDLAADYESMKEAITEVHRLGISLSIDDFGMGQSSLSRLKDFPVSHLKIDGTFIRDIERSRSDNALVRSMVELAHAQDLLVTAEWVETASQAEILRSIHCDFAQGYHVSPALPAEEFVSFARKWASRQAMHQAA